MSYTIAQLKNDLTAVIHGTTLNQIQNLDGLIDRAGRKLVSELDPIETIRIAQINNALYDDVYDYSCPADLKGDRIIDIRPQVNRTTRDRFFQVYNEEFDLYKAKVNPAEVTVQYNTAVKSLRIKKNLTQGLLLNNCNSLTANGTWTVGGSATDLTVDELNYITAGGSLRCNLSAGANPSTGYFENSTMEAVDLSRDEGIGSLFVWVYLPTGSNFTNIILRWGSSSSNYWSATATSANNSVAFQNGWNLVRFDWSSATETGTPDSSAVDYLRVTGTYNGTAMTAFRIDNIVSQLGSIYEIEYYSKYIFRSSAGTFQETVLDDEDEINLDTDSYNLLFNLVAMYAVQQQQSSNGNFDYAFFEKQYEQDKARYIAKNKSQVMKPQQVYYAMPKRNVKTIRYSSN
jgi:hypothetical protein